MPEPTTTSAPVTEGPGETPAAQAGTPGATSAPTPAPIVFTPEQQAEIDRIAARARAEGRTAGQTAAQQEAARQAAAAQAAAQAEQGQFKPLYEATIKDLDTVRAELAAERRTNLISRLAGAANLPANLHKFVVGADEAEIAASVQELAAAVRPPPAPHTGAGQGTRPQPAAGQPGAPAALDPNRFVPAGYVPLPPEN